MDDANIRKIVREELAKMFIQFGRTFAPTCPEKPPEEMMDAMLVASQRVANSEKDYKFDGRRVRYVGSEKDPANLLPCCGYPRSRGHEWGPMADECMAVYNREHCTEDTEPPGDGEYSSLPMVPA